MTESHDRPLRAKSILAERGLSIAAVAQALAMDPTNLGKVLAGKSAPSRRTMLQIANLLGLDKAVVFPEYALGVDREQPGPDAA